jgi:hypothetical protein
MLANIKSWLVYHCLPPPPILQLPSADTHTESHTSDRLLLSLPFGYLESIEWFIEDQAFMLSYDLAPRPLPFIPSPISKKCVAG